jgi:hypothetical protein
MTDTQKRIKLSREDFEIMLKKTTTGRAHSVLMDYLATGESIESIYHLFMLNFDKRITPLEAKMQLNSLKATKSQNLAKVTTQISQLAVRANSILPEGDSRNHSYNLDCAQALMRALPTTSSHLVSNTYHHLTAQRGRAATFVELTRKLDIYMDSIDSDIKRNGVEPKAKGNFQKNSGKRYNNPSHTAYGLQQGDARGAVAQGGNGGEQNSVYGVSSKPTHTGQFDKSVKKKRYPNKRNFNNGNNKKTCSLCGQSTHKFDSCPNMVSDSGKKIPVIPSQDTCNRCPPSVNPRLHHNAAICPFRKGGVLEGTA